VTVLSQVTATSASGDILLAYGATLWLACLRLRGRELHEIPPVPTSAVPLEHPPRPAGIIASAGQKSTDTPSAPTDLCRTDQSVLPCYDDRRRSV